MDDTAQVSTAENLSRSLSITETTILLVIAVALGVSIGYTIYHFTMKPSSAPLSYPVTGQPMKTSSPTAVPRSPQSDWNTYVNKAVGFSFSYPSDTFVIEENSTHLVFGMLNVSYNKMHPLLPDLDNRLTDNQINATLTEAIQTNNEKLLSSIFPHNNAQMNTSGNVHFITIFPGVEKGCSCYIIYYITRIGTDFVTISETKANRQPVEKSIPTFAPHEIMILSDSEFSTKLKTDTESLIKEIFGDLPGVIKTFKLIPPSS